MTLKNSCCNGLIVNFLEKGYLTYRHLLQFQQKFIRWANEGSVSLYQFLKKNVLLTAVFGKWGLIHNSLFSQLQFLLRAFLKHFSDSKTCILNVLSSGLYVVMCNAYLVNNQNPVYKIFPSCNECQKLKGYDSVILTFISSRLSCYSDSQLIKIHQTRNGVF